MGRREAEGHSIATSRIGSRYIYKYAILRGKVFPAAALFYLKKKDTSVTTSSMRAIVRYVTDLFQSIRFHASYETQIWPLKR